MRPLGAVVLPLLLVVPGVASGAAVNGAWTTYMRAFTFADLAVRDGSVWCGTLEDGLLRFDPATGAYEEFVRRPDGLAGNAVAAVTFDRAGDLWAGTLGNGASVLDLEHDAWRLINVFDGLPSDSVRVIEADGDSLWIGTTRGLALWDGLQIAGVLPDGVGPSPFASNRISGVATIGDTVWVATEEGIYRSLRSTDLASWTAVNGGLPGLQVDALASDGRVLMAMASDGAWRYDSAGDAWVSQDGLGKVRGLSDDAGRIALAATSGIWLWNGSGWDRVAPTLISTTVRGGVYAVGIADDGALYAANRDGVRVLATGATTFPPGGPGNDNLNVEIQGPRVYATTVSDGIGRFETGTWRYWFPGVTHSDTTFREPLFAYAIATDTLGRKWIATWARLISTATCTPDTGAIEILDDSVNPPHVTHIIVDDAYGEARHTYAIGSSRDSSGGLWFGLTSPCSDVPSFASIGLDHYDGDGNFIANYNVGVTSTTLRGREVRTITVDRNGRIWIGYKGQGIDIIDDPANPTFTSVSGSTSLDVRGLEARGDSIWTYTTSDVRRYNLTRGLAQVLPNLAGPSDLSVRPLDVGTDGRVWVGTSGGVRVYGPGTATQDYTTANSPLPDNDVRTIRVDPVSGVVWIATAGGLARFDPGYTVGGSVGAALAVRVYPNPIRLTALGLGLRLATDAARVTGAVYGLDGRRVHTFQVSGSDRVIWDGRDGHGALVHPGVFFVRVESGGRSAVARVAVLR